MNVLVLTFYTPYRENKGGISALIYYLIKYRPNFINLRMLSFNANGLSNIEISSVEKELGIQITILPLPWWFISLRKSSLYRKVELLFPKTMPCYIRFPRWVFSYINQFDVIWIYPYFFSGIAGKFKKKFFVVTGCDSNYMLNTRIKNLGLTKGFLSRLSLFLNLKKSKHIERSFVSRNLLVHFVGKNDESFYKKHTHAQNAFYSAHPHYVTCEKNIEFSGKRIRVILAGANDRYMKPGADDVLKCILQNSDILSDKIELTFLGKGWRQYEIPFAQQGFTVNIKEWVKDYIKEIISYDVQLSPISIGTGTKGKVLDAMANGLLVIGTDYAMENICDDGDGCLLYHNPTQVVEYLNDIYHNRKKYEAIASYGRNRVRSEHDGCDVAKDFFSHFRKA